MTIPKKEKNLVDRKMFNIHHKTRQSPLKTRNMLLFFRNYSASEPTTTTITTIYRYKIVR